MSYDNTNRGTLFKNEDKQKDTHADYNGSINIEGKEYWLNAWVKEAGENSKNPGKKFFSLSVKPKQAKQGQSQPAPSSRDHLSEPPIDNRTGKQSDDFVDSEIPF